jgi:hypothetical protein
LLSAGFFLDFFFDLEDGDIFLRNINWLSTHYKVLYSSR